MLVFPNIEGSGTVSFSFTKTTYVQFGEALTYLGVGYIVVRLLLDFGAMTKVRKLKENREVEPDSARVNDGA